MNPPPSMDGDHSLVENTIPSSLLRKDESQCLQYILSGSSVESFLGEIYQKSCALYCAPKSTALNVPNPNRVAWSEQKHSHNPLQAIIENGFTVLTELMDQTNGELGDANNILLFHNQQMVSADERISKYSSVRCDKSSQEQVLNLYAAYLNGCSVVINHADRYSPWIASLCNDLQRSFPHVYANVYITPPGSQTVPPHSDDRDVLILQIHGVKEWTVYQRVPIPYPFTHEQVGKDPDHPVPDAVLQGPLLLQTMLQPGDVLYMPRGYVHEARCHEKMSMGSFHITIAIATHDWSLLGLLQEACQSIFSQRLPIECRKAISYPSFGKHPSLSANSYSKDSAIVQQQIDDALQVLKEEFTIENINSALFNKYQRHNRCATEQRQAMMQRYRQLRHAVESESEVVGYSAARMVTLQSRIRVATLLEKETARRHSLTSCGLHVREEIHDAILSMIQHVQKHAEATFVVQQLRSNLMNMDEMAPDESSLSASLVCDLSLLCMVRRCVELGAFAVCHFESEQII
jgi:ribosomal protein L16 Arg81 hydroxylase